MALTEQNYQSKARDLCQGCHYWANWWTFISHDWITTSPYSPKTCRTGLMSTQWASYQLRKIAGCACAGNAGNVYPPPRISDPDMHHGTCVTHVPWCMPGSLTRGFYWSWWWGKRSRHSRRMHNPQFYISGKRPVWGDVPNRRIEKKPTGATFPEKIHVKRAPLAIPFE